MQGMIAKQMGPKAKPGMMEKSMPPEGQDSSAVDQGMAFVRKALYGAEAAREVAASLKKAPEPSQGLADTAYEMVRMADEATDGAIPDEQLIQFASDVLGEVADIAIAAGIEVKGAQIAKAVQTMLLRYVSEQGLDVTQLKQAMSQVDPEEVGATLDKVA